MLCRRADGALTLNMSRNWMNGSTSPRRLVKSCPASDVNSMHSSMDSSGNTNIDSPRPIWKPLMIASVSGNRTDTVVPAPSSLRRVTSPRKAVMLRFTTSMPTPRPDRFVTCSAVEKPGSKMRLKISDSVSVRPASIRPRSWALARILSRLRPPPSSLTSMTMVPES